MDLFDHSARPLSVFLNGHINRRRTVELFRHMSLRDLLEECVAKFKLPVEGKYRLFDAQGGELDEDDLEYIVSDEPLFLSKGEDFIQSSSLAVYEELEMLGKGGFGTVKLYQHRLNHTQVAIKFVDLEVIPSTLGLARVYKEVQILRTLHHANIVEMKDAFSIGSAMCFVMEYCKGGELGRFLAENGPLPEDRVFSIAIQLVDGIMYCHNAGVIHRDLKLENILFADAMRSHIKIVDFGISGMFTVGGASETSGAGSVRYLAPEVLTGSDQSSHPSLDIWSIGCIIYALLTGTLPFDGNSRAEIVEKIVALEFQSLPDWVSRPWHCLINGVLRRNPRRRWPLIRIDEFLRAWRSSSSDPSKLQDSSSSSSSDSDDNKETDATPKPPPSKKSQTLSVPSPKFRMNQRRTITLAKPIARRMLSPALAPTMSSGALRRLHSNSHSGLMNEAKAKLERTRKGEFRGPPLI